MKSLKKYKNLNMRNNYQQSEDSVTRISRSKSRNQVNAVAKLREKESGWNDRFHLNNIPEYNFQNQPHSQYLKNKFRMPNRKNDPSRHKRLHQPSLEKNKVSNKPNPRRNQEKLKQAITKAFSDLKKLWYERGLPQCHMEAMTKLFNRENNPMKILEDIKREYSEVTNETSLAQKSMSSIVTRQNCLQKIQELLQNFHQLDPAKIKKQFEEKIAHLRILTIHCIQCIFHWKQSLESMGPKGFRVKYIHNGKLYTQKVKSDYQDIAQSSFNEIYKFETHKVDPFFLNLTVEGKKIGNVSKNLVKRIRMCEIMLNEDSEAPVQAKRTPIIEKIKSPPRQGDLRDHSLPPRGKTPTILPWTKVPVEYSQLNDYLHNLLSKGTFSESFSPQIDLGRYQEITIFRSSETEEEVIVAVDKNASQRKIFILGVKSNLQGVESLLKNLGEYLWEHDYCNQIRVSLVHKKCGQTSSVDSDLQKKLKGVGFRWASVNNNNDIRMTIYAMKRPLDTVAHKTSRRTQSYPVIIEHLSIFNLAENLQKKVPSRCFISVIDMIRRLAEWKKEDYDEVCQRDQFSHHLDCIKKVKQYLEKQAIQYKCQPEQFFSYSGMKSFEVQNQQTLQKVFRNMQIPVRRAKVPSILTMLNTSFKFKHTSIQDGKYTKFFPSKDNQILIVESNYPIYLLQTDQENINFFVIEVNENFSMESIESIFTAMGEQSSFIDEFWLPTFYKSEEYVDEVGFPSTEISSTNYRNCLGSLTRKSKVRTKIIKAPFVFGMINKKLLEILEIPFFCTLVRKQDLV